MRIIIRNYGGKMKMKNKIKNIAIIVFMLFIFLLSGICNSPEPDYNNTEEVQVYQYNN